MYEENWDDANHPPYTPQIENKPIIRKTPPKLTKGEKKKFYEKERERWARLRANIQHQADSAKIGQQ